MSLFKKICQMLVIVVFLLIYNISDMFVIIFLFRKARRKEREGGDSGTSGDPKLYLEAAVLERKLPEMDLRVLVELPPGLDYNEWLASHSKYLSVLLTSSWLNSVYLSLVVIYYFSSSIVNVLITFCVRTNNFLLY